MAIPIPVICPEMRIVLNVAEAVPNCSGLTEFITECVLGEKIQSPNLKLPKPQRKLHWCFAACKCQHAYSKSRNQHTGEDNIRESYLRLTSAKSCENGHHGRLNH